MSNTTVEKTNEVIPSTAGNQFFGKIPEREENFRECAIIGLIKNQKKWNIVSMISLIIFSIIYIINGFYDYHKFTSTKIAIIIFLFYIIVFLVKRFLDKNTHIDN